jgi:putative hydrolase of the HAD superfamily
MITCVVFDLDDTLYDEMDFVKSGYLEIANLLNATFGVDKTLTYNRLIDLFELDRKRVLNRLCIELNIEISDALIELYRYHQPTISLKSDVIEILNELKISFKLGILTDGDSVTQWNKFRALMQTARFYFTRLMPETSSLMRRIRAGSDVLMDTDAALA